MPALQGLDLERHRPTWLVIEARYRQEIDEVIDCGEREGVLGG